MSDEKTKEEVDNSQPLADSAEVDVESDKAEVEIESDKAEPVEENILTADKEDVTNTGKSSLFAVLAPPLSILAIALVVLVGYFGYQQIQHLSGRLLTLEQKSKKARATVEQTKTSLTADFSKIQSEVQQVLNSQTIENEKKLQQVAEQINASRRQLQLIKGRHQSDWLLAEADYLVRIATQRLLLEQDHVTALALLLNADERIMLMDDPAMQVVREALARDIATLRLVKRVDIAGLAIRIIGLIPQLNILPLQSFELPEDSIEEASEPVIATDATWRENLKKTLKELSVKWFEVRNHGKPVKPLMSSETETLLISNMTLLLQTAQFATLRGHSDLYHHSLSQIADWSNEYFDNADASVLAFINEIKSLNQMSVKVNLPVTIESRLILSRQVEQKLQQSDLSNYEPGSQE